MYFYCSVLLASLKWIIFNPHFPNFHINAPCVISMWKYGRWAAEKSFNLKTDGIIKIMIFILGTESNLSTSHNKGTKGGELSSWPQTKAKKRSLHHATDINYFSSPFFTDFNFYYTTSSPDYVRTVIINMAELGRAIDFNVKTLSS